MKLIQCLMLLGMSVLLAACGTDQRDSIFKEVKVNVSATESALNTLNIQLEQGTLRNAVLLKPYAKLARANKPEFAQIIDVLASEATRKGPTYKQIVQRFAEVKPLTNAKPATVAEGQSTNLELLSIRTAIINYDAMLVDAINVLSEFTDGALPKMREIEFEDSKAEGGDIGSEYVGNSSYGEWRQNSSGTSFWHWYGQYAFFSSMFRGPVYYDHWSYNRRPSYYHDRSNGAYTSPSSRRNNSTTLSRTKKSYSAKGKSFKSPYARNTKIKGVSGSTVRGQANKPFKSKYASSGSSSSSKTKSYKSSSYNSRSSSSSRSSYGGK